MYNQYPVQLPSLPKKGLISMYLPRFNMANGLEWAAPAWEEEDKKDTPVAGCCDQDDGLQLGEYLSFINVCNGWHH